MKNLLIALFAAVSLTGCATFNSAPVPDASPTPPIAVSPTANQGVMVSFNPMVALQDVWEWIKDSPGRILFGAFIGYVGRDVARAKGY